MNVGYCGDYFQYTEILDNATSLLQEVVGTANVSATWTVEPRLGTVAGDEGKVIFWLNLQEGTDKASQYFTLSELSGTYCKGLMARLWGDVLKLRSDRQTERIKTLSTIQKNVMHDAKSAREYFREMLTAFGLIEEQLSFLASCCDKPEDRMYHASDGTWWKREGNHWYGADPPEGWVRK